MASKKQKKTTKAAPGSLGEKLGEAYDRLPPAVRAFVDSVPAQYVVIGAGYAKIAMERIKAHVDRAERQTVALENAASHLARMADMMQAQSDRVIG